MSILDDFIGNDNTTTLNDKDIASGLLGDVKFAISSLTKATSEAVNPELRSLVDSQLTSTVQSQHRLSDMMVQKGWYLAYESPENQLQSSLQEAQSFLTTQRDTVRS